MRYRNFVFFILVSITAGAAHAMDPGTSEQLVESIPQVVVQGVHNPALKPYATMVEGLRVFEKLNHLAPRSELRFMLNSVGGRPELLGINLRISSENNSVSVPVDSENMFSLPQLEWAVRENAELVLNVPKSAVRWRAVVRTAGLPENAFRLGDLRLACEVMWAIEKNDTSFFDKSMIRLAGGLCTSSRVSVSFPIMGGARGVTAQVDGRQLRSPLAAGGKSFIPPLHDRSLGDDTLFFVEYTPMTPATEPGKPQSDQ